MTKYGNPVREAVKYLEYGKDNYWDGDKIIDHTIEVALMIFKQAFPDCQALYAFDNASNHCSFAHDAPLASKMNFGPAGKQPVMRDGFFKGVRHPMNFAADYPYVDLRGKPKGIKQVLSKMFLWSDTKPDSSKLMLACISQKGKVTCDGTACCARTL